MSPSFLQKVFKGSAGDRVETEPFQLPGALFDGVKVLLIDSGDPTDLLFSMPLVEEIHDRFPHAHVGLVSDERLHYLALSSGAFHEVIVFSPEQLKLNSKGFSLLADAVGAEAWDVAILLGRHQDPPREELALVSGARLRVGPAHERAYPRVNCAVRSSAEEHYPYRRTATWGKLFGLPLEHVPLNWPLPESKLRQVAQLVHFNKPRKDQLLVGVDPGVGKMGTRLGLENLAFLVNHLGKRISSKSIVLTADEDEERPAAFESLLTVDLLRLPRPTLMEVVLLLSQCDLFISGNTDLFHYAVALGVPALGLFTSRDGRRWRPDEGESVEILELEDGVELELATVMSRVDALLE